MEDIDRSNFEPFFYNCLYGGYGLSSDVLRELYISKSKSLPKPTSYEKYFGKYKPFDVDKWIYDDEIQCYMRKHHNYECNKKLDGYIYNKQTDELYTFGCYSIPRYGWELHDIIHKIGLSKSSDEMCQLKCIYIPSDKEIRVHEYDGKEDVVIIDPVNKIWNEIQHILNTGTYTLKNEKMKKYIEKIKNGHQY